MRDRDFEVLALRLCGISDREASGLCDDISELIVRDAPMQLAVIPSIDHLSPGVGPSACLPD